jgi:hypothetical protein
VHTKRSPRFDRGFGKAGARVGGGGGVGAARLVNPRGEQLFRSSALVQSRSAFPSSSRSRAKLTAMRRASSFVV